ncbi:MAG: diguanylate cyclase [Roseovarius sp.]|uniref:diguanylate cyclase n=1 Tax=Roseovarius sp. TaxID=1486281 RepID=UPI0032EBA2DF
MSGKILIVDELATNRIVLKVKLSATPYDVLQAASAQEALDIAKREQPDLILTSSQISGLTLDAFIAALRRLTGATATPILVLQAHDCRDERHAALRAGADDILTTPVAEPLLLARLRNLLRQHHTDHELAAQASGGRIDPGFADQRSDFMTAGRIAVIGQTRAEAIQLRDRITAHSAHAYTALTLDARTAPALTDIYMIRISMAHAEDGLRLLADLKAAQRTRGCPVVAILDPDARPLAVTLLDIGADDVIAGPIDHIELALRLDTHLRRKQRNEGLRARLLSGLQAAIVDPLTGAYNRRYALPFLDRQISESRTNDTQTAVMLADLDFFKRVNDRHGHAAGDAVLCAITQHLRSQLRDGDALARIGGEEFLLILPDTPRRRALQIAERLCRSVRESPIHLPGSRTALTVTISIGVTIGRHRPGLPAPTVEGLLNEADRALYLAKAQGRNQASLCARSAA